MALTKDARKIVVDGKNYRWKVGKLRREDGYIYSDVIIELPTGKIRKFEECMGTTDIGVQYPITPDTVRNLITSHSL